MSIKIDKKILKDKILEKAFLGELTEEIENEDSIINLLTSKGYTFPTNHIEKNFLNWVILNHNEILTISGGSQPSKSFFSEDNLEGYVRMYQTRDYGKHPQPVYIPKIYAKKTTEKGDILLARYGGSLGKVFKAEKGAYNVALAKVIQKYEVFDNEYLWWYYNSIHYKNFVKGVSRSAQAGFNKEDMNKMKIPIPPLAEQKRIVAKIERAFELIDSMDVDSLLQDISDFRQEVLTRAFRGDLTEQNFDEGTGQELLKQIQAERAQQPTKGKKKAELAPVLVEEEPYDLPPNWTWTRLGEMAEIRHGYAFKGDFFSDSKTARILMTPGNISGRGEYLTNKNRYYDDSVGINKDFLLNEGDLVMNLTDLTRDCNTLGKCVFIPKCQEEILHNQRLGLVQMPKYNRNLFYYFSLSENYFGQIIKSATGTTVRHTSPTKVLNFLIPLPPLAEQERIVAKIEAIFSALDVMEDAITKQKDEAKSCYEEILRKEMGTAEERKERKERGKELELTSEELVEQRVG